MSVKLINDRLPFLKFGDKLILRLREYYFDGSSWSTKNLDVSMLPQKPSLPYIEAVREIGKHDIHLLFTCTDTADNYHVGSIILFGFTPIGASKPLNLFTMPYPHDIKSIVLLKSLRGLEIFHHENLFDYGINEAPDGWIYSSPTTVTVQKANGYKILRYNAPLAGNAYIASDYAGIYDDFTIIDELPVPLSPMPYGFSFYGRVGQTDKDIYFGTADNLTPENPDPGNNLNLNVRFGADGDIYICTTNTGVSYSADTWYHFFVEDLGDGLARRVYINGQGPYTGSICVSGTELPYNKYFVIKSAQDGASASIYDLKQFTHPNRAETPQTYRPTANEHDAFMLYGIYGSWARFMSAFAFELSRIRTEASRILHGHFRLDSKGDVLRDIGRSVKTPRLLTGPENSFEELYRNRLKAYTETRDPVISEFQELGAYYAGSDPSEIEIEDIEPGIWKLTRPQLWDPYESYAVPRADLNSYYQSFWEQFLERIKPLATNIEIPDPGPIPGEVEAFEDDFEAYTLTETDPDDWSLYYNYGISGTEQVSYGVDNTRAQSPTKSYYMYFKSENNIVFARNGQMNLIHALSNIRFELGLTASVYIETLTSSQYGAGAGFLIHFVREDDSNKAIFYRMGYITQDVLPNYYTGSSWVASDVKINIANTTGSWITLSNRNLKTDYENQSWGEWDNLKEINLILIVYAGDGPTQLNTGIAEAFFDDITVDVV
jgi:hypothetical protein